MTKEYIKDAFVLLDSDILFQREIIKRLTDSSHECCLAVNCHKCGEEEIKIVVDDKYRVSEISKTIHPRSALGESIGIEFFSGNGKDKMFETLHKRVISENRINEWYEASFQEWIDNGGDLYAVDISDYLAMEVDFPEDIKSAEEIIIPVIDK
jgi:choline kinase